MELRPGRAGALVDTPDGVVVTGAPPRARVTIEASLELSGLSWSCVGEYVVDDNGEVDTARAASVGGSYHGVDPFGLFWSADVPRRPDPQSVRPLNVTLRATCEDLVCDASYLRRVQGDGVTDHVVDATGVVGRLFAPAEEGGSRAVVLLSGSEGGMAWPLMGALLASHGVTSLSLAYFGRAGVPDQLRDIDVEVVGRACDWLRRVPGVEDQPPSVIGISRSGELALLAAALEPDKVGPVVSLVGSGVAWGELDEQTGAHVAAWRFEGEPVPQLREDPDHPLALLDDAEALAAAEIPVERATGPVLLLSGEDDGFWPSARLSRIAEARAQREGCGEKVVHVAYRDAGHGVGSPPGLAMPSVVHLGEATLRPGGTRAGNQAARVDAWSRILEHVGAPIR